MNELKQFSSFEELKADGKPTENMEETIRRYKEYEEGIIFLRSKIVKKPVSDKIKHNKNEK
ncbi:hypothetical protein WAF17_16900 [Bernardetia sp. ABR2-2B]|uniref:hypothetical protein n=1 Tax=Bernardetia sp. ABR2-2B TaxID=3127472 RepID=UPI0030CCDA4D